MKTRLLFFLILCCNVLTQAQIIAPQWDHVGPLSTNEPNVSPSHPDYNAFRSGRIDDLAVNPGNSNHIVAGSFFAGIWQTYNVYNPPPGWEILPNFEEDYPNGMGYGGVASIAFRNSNELYAANLIYVNSKNYYSTKVFKYDYNANPTIWTQLGALPFANQMDVKINKIVFYPNDPDRVFLCTSAGLVESADAGATWFNSPAGNPVSGNIFNIVFIEKSTPGDYFWYISGSDTPGNDYQGHAMLMESDNGAAFADVTAFSGNFSNIHSYAGLCLGDQTATNGDRDILIYTAIDQGSDWASNNRNVHKATKNIINTTIQ